MDDLYAIYGNEISLNKVHKPWLIDASSRNEGESRVNIRSITFAEDAGAAWLKFSEQFPNAKWYKISVTEVKRNEAGS